VLGVVAGCLAGGTLLSLAALWRARRWPSLDAGNRTRRRPPRGVDPALALLIRTGLDRDGRSKAPMVVLAELVHRRVIRAAPDGGDSWRLRYADRAAELAGYEQLLVKVLFGGGSRTTLNVDTLRSIGPTIAGELRTSVRDDGGHDHDDGHHDHGYDR